MIDKARCEGVLIRRMALTHTEFLRTLPAATLGWERRIEGPRIMLSRNTHRVEIHLGQEGEHKIGSLSLPQTDIELCFFGLDNAARHEFLKRFDLAYHRGGG